MPQPAAPAPRRPWTPQERAAFNKQWGATFGPAIRDRVVPEIARMDALGDRYHNPLLDNMRRNIARLQAGRKA